jgi:polysaccharide export outer membrane protein
MKNYFFKVSFFLLLLLVCSCSAYKTIPYLKDASNETINTTDTFEPKICINDELTILVNTTIPEAAAPFNLAIMPSSVSGSTVNSTQALQTYLVGTDGTINFPIIGKLQVKGKTKKELEELIKAKIYPKYITEEPVITIRYVNYKIFVLGEVVKPGSFTVTNERVTVFDALAFAGDLTIYGKRNNVLVLRENENGKKETARLNLQDKDILKSPYFYLRQNDVVYVEPNKHKANSSAISTGESISVSVVSALVSIASLLVTILR